MPDSLVTPIKNCSNQDQEDGTCRHPNNMTPECHVFVCPRISQPIRNVFDSVDDVLQNSADSGADTNEETEEMYEDFKNLNIAFAQAREGEDYGKKSGTM